MIDFPLSATMLIAPRKAPHSAWLGHIPFASWLVEQLRPQRIVELGTHNGASFLGFCQAVEEQQVSSRVFAVDTWEGDEHAGFYGDEVYRELRDYQQRHYAGISEMMRMRFDQALEYFAEGSIDLLHIDGLHTYEAVKEDFESWRSKLSSRAVVLFHDSCVRERGFGVWQYWSEISTQFPHFEFTHTHGLGVLLVGSEQAPALLRVAEAHAAGNFAPINRLFDLLGRNIKNVEEIERVNAGLSAAHREIGRLSQREQALEVDMQRLSAEIGGRQSELIVQNEALIRSIAEVHQHAREAEQQVKERMDAVDSHFAAHRASLANAVEQVTTAVGNSAARIGQQVEQSAATLAGEMTAAIVVPVVHQTVGAVVDAVVPPVRSMEAKLDRLLAPWWSRAARR